MSDVTPLIIRNIDGDHVILTEDGKELSGQVKHLNHYWYEGQGKERRGYFRATFCLKGMKDKAPE